MTIEDDLDRLYAEPLDRFTAERNAIATAAKKTGDDETARSIKNLKKPSVGAWTINQLVRRRPESVRELLDVRERLEGVDSPAELRGLSKRRRELVSELSTFARQILEESGHGASPATVDKVAQGLLAGGTDDERELLRKGRLSREPASSGLEALGFDAVADIPEDAAPEVSMKARREVERLRRDAERLQQEAARLEQEAAFAQEQARRAREKADEAERAAEAARAKANEAAEAAGL